MPHMFIRHDVADFNAWKPQFDEHSGVRSQHGISDVGVHRGLENANNLTIVFQVEDIDRAKAFVSSENLKEVMTKAGVQGQPSIWFTD